MRRVLIVTAAALALGVSGAVAAPMHGGGFGHGGHGFGHAGGFGHGHAAAMSGMMAAPRVSAGANLRANNVAAPNNFVRNNFARGNFARGPHHYRSRYALNEHRHRGWYGGGWDGLYAYEPGYNTCYDNGYGPYYNGYYNNGYYNSCYYNYNEPGPSVSFGWGW